MWPEKNGNSEVIFIYDANHKNIRKISELENNKQVLKLISYIFMSA